MSATGQRVHDVILRGGRTLRLRPPSERDADAVRRFLTELSPTSMRLRFHGARRVDDAMVASFLDPDWTSDGVLLATAVGADESDRVIGLATLFPPARPAPGGGVVRRGRRPPGRWNRNTAARADRRRGRQGGDRALRRRGAAREPADAAGLRRLGLRGQPHRRWRGDPRRLPDPLRRALPRGGGLPRSHRCRAVAVACPRAGLGGRRRRVRARRVDRWRRLPEHRRGRLHRIGLPGQPLRRARRRAPGARLGRRAARAHRSGGHRGAVGRRPGRGRRGARRRREGGVRDLGRIRRNGADRREGRGRPARPRPLARCTHGRPELPRRLRRRDEDERNVLAPPVRAGQRRPSRRRAAPLASR